MDRGLPQELKGQFDKHYLYRHYFHEAKQMEKQEFKQPQPKEIKNETNQELHATEAYFQPEKAELTACGGIVSK